MTPDSKTLLPAIALGILAMTVFCIPMGLLVALIIMMCK